MNYGKKTCVLVLGMHRSGTSVLAGLLNILGVSLGDTLLAPGDDNPKGYFEHADFYRINVAFLESFGLDGDGRQGELPKDWLHDERTEVFKKTVREHITRHFSDTYIFGLKDPRISILLPVYLEVLQSLDVEIRAVIAERPVAEVSLSLEKRNQTPLHESIAAYAYYYRIIDAYVTNVPHVRVAYHDVLHHTQDVVNRIIKTVHYALRPYGEVAEKVHTFIAPELRHHAISDIDFLNRLSHEWSVYKQQAAHMQHEHATVRTARAEDMKWLQHTITSLEARYAELVRAHEQQHKQHEATYAQHIAEHATALQTAKNTITTLEQTITTLRQEVAQVTEAFNQYKHTQHLEYLRADAHRKHVEQLVVDRNQHIQELHTMLTNIERSFVWKCVKAWELFLKYVLPEGTPVRRWYYAGIRFNQHVINDLLPMYILRFLKKKTHPVVEKPKETFWDTFHRAHPATDILCINHEESRTGAPRIIFDIGTFLKQTYRVSMVSLKKGSMHQEFEHTFGPVIYPDEVFHLHTMYDKAVHILKEVQPKLVYVNSIGSYQFARAAKALGIPVIFHVHELDIAFQIVFSKKERTAFHTFADTFIAVSEPVYTLLVDKMHCPKERVILLHEFVNRASIIEQSNALTPEIVDKELARESKEIVVLAVGMFIYRKGADMFMKMAKSVIEKGLPVKFVWVGSRPFKEPFMADFNTYAPYFTLLQEKINPFPYVRNADIVILPSREDPFPLAILEAMALGKPTIVFKDAGGIKEAVKDAGVIVSPMEQHAFETALIDLVHNHGKRESLGTKAQQYQEAYDSSILLQQFQKIVADTINAYTSAT